MKKIKLIESGRILIAYKSVKSGMWVNAEDCTTMYELHRVQVIGDYKKD